MPLKQWERLIKIMPTKKQDSRDTYNRKKEGEITVNHVNDKRKSGIDPKNTEYVDYEEIK